MKMGEKRGLLLSMKIPGMDRKGIGGSCMSSVGAAVLVARCVLLHEMPLLRGTDATQKIAYDAPASRRPVPEHGTRGYSRAMLTWFTSPEVLSASAAPLF
jgi:hypothetical protein